MKAMIPQTEVLAWCAANGLECEIDRAWVWLTTPLAPLHRKCECAECAARAALRKVAAGYGFRFSKADHVLGNGHTSRWGHSCERPTRFFKGSGKAKAEAGNEDTNLAALAAMLEAL